MTILRGLEKWEYEVVPGFHLRGLASKPTGKPVLHMLHGNGFCGLVYEPLLAHLQSDYDLFISDVQGHGDSDAGGAFRGWDATAKLTRKVWLAHKDKWRDVPKIALGHSFGAVLSTLILSENPDLFDAAILMDPVYSPPRMARSMSLMGRLGLMRYMPLARQARIRTTSWASYQAAWDYLYQRGTFKGWQDACLQAYLTHALYQDDEGQMQLKCPAEIEAAIFSTYPKKLWQAIPRIRKPVCLIYGQKTFGFLKKALPKVHQINQYYDFLEMPGGHCFMQEAPEETANEIKQKLRMMGF